MQHLPAYLLLLLLDHNQQQQHHVLSFPLWHKIVFIKWSGSFIKMLCDLMIKLFLSFIHNKKTQDWAVLSLLIPHLGKNQPPVWQQEQLVTGFKAATDLACQGAHPCFRRTQDAGNSYSTMNHSNKTTNWAMRTQRKMYNFAAYPHLFNHVSIHE